MDEISKAVLQAVQSEYEKSLTRGSAQEIDKSFQVTKTLYYDTNSSGSGTGSAEDKEALSKALLQCYKSAVSAFISTPVLSPKELHLAKEAAVAALKAQTQVVDSKQAIAAQMEVRKNQLLQTLNTGVEKMKMEIHEKYKKLG